MRPPVYEIRHYSRGQLVAGAWIMLAIGAVLVMLVVAGSISPWVIVPVLVFPVAAYAFLKGELLTLDVDQLRSTGAQKGASVPYSSIAEVRVLGDAVEIRLSEGTNVWRRFNFLPRWRKFTLNGDVQGFLSEMESRLGEVHRENLPDGGIVLRRPIDHTLG